MARDKEAPYPFYFSDSPSPPSPPYFPSTILYFDSFFICFTESIRISLTNSTKKTKVVYTDAYEIASVTLSNFLLFPRENFVILQF